MCLKPCAAAAFADTYAYKGEYGVAIDCMAALGKGYREILTNFYSGISLTANYGR